VSTTKPLWSELTAEQQQALKPLIPHWNTLNVGAKKKWLALSRNFASMSADDQVTLHSRMIEWAALSNQQRTQARLNFAEVKRIPPDERKAKWEQYQALSEEEKRKLAERAPAKPRGAAIPVRPRVVAKARARAGRHAKRTAHAKNPAGAARRPRPRPATIMVASPPERTPTARAPPAVPVARSRERPRRPSRFRPKPRCRPRLGDEPFPPPDPRLRWFPVLPRLRGPGSARFALRTCSTAPVSIRCPASGAAWPAGSTRACCCSPWCSSGWLFSTLSQMRDAMDERRHLLLAFLFVVFGVYFVWFWTKGQTLAMKTWNIRIVDRMAARSPSARLFSLPAELDLVPAAAGAITPFKLPVAKPGAALRLDRRLGPARTLSPRAPVLARRLGRYAAHHLQTDEPPMSALPKTSRSRRQPAEGPQGPRARLACHADLAARPARRLERTGLPPGSHPVDGR
jgi:hypothetical protein